MKYQKIASLWFAWLFVLLLATAGGFGACGTQQGTEPTTETSQPDAGGETTLADAKADAGQIDTAPELPPEPTIKIRASGPTLALEPGKRGPYAVGVTTIRLTDESRKDKDGTPRPMVIEVWYPAVDSAKGGQTDVYDISTDAPDAVKKKIEELQLPSPQMPQNAYRDAKPLYEEGPYPVILFSHGSGGIRFQSVFQTTHLASHGYVVISPDHEGNTLYNLFLDQNAQDPTRLIAAAGERPLDMKFAMEAVKKRVETEGDVLYKIATFEKLGMTGHSFGGLTSILVTRTFDNLAAIIPQAPATSFIRLLGVTGDDLYDVPVMVLAAQKDNTLDYQKEQKSFYDKTLEPGYYGNERHLVTFTNGGHFTYSNICDLDLKKYADKLGFGNAANILNDGCASFNTPIDKAHEWINHYATALFNVLLRKSEDSRSYLKQLETPEIKYESKPKP